MKATTRRGNSATRADRLARGAVLLLMLLAVTGCDLVGGQAGQKPAAAVPPPPPVVEVTEVLVQDLPLVREWVGVLDGNVNATIRSQVTGYLINQRTRVPRFPERSRLPGE